MEGMMKLKIPELNAGEIYAGAIINGNNNGGER